MKKNTAERTWIAQMTACVLFVIFVSTAAAQNEMGPQRTPVTQREAGAVPAPRQPTAPEAQISYTPPAGWSVTALQQSRFKVATGPAGLRFVPNITVAEAAFPGSISQFIAENIKAMKAEPETYRIVSQGAFNGRAGLKGIKFVFEITKDKRSFRNAQYIFDPGQGRPFLLVNCATAAEDGARYSSIFDDSMRTFDVK